MPTVLATAFGPWGDHALNASWEGLSQMDATLPLGWDLQTRHLPVAWGEAPQLLTQAITDDTRIVIAFGQADAPAFRIERLAVNAADRSAEDVNGNCHAAPELVSGGPPAYATTLPWQALVDDLAAAGIPVEESHTAGSYLCNASFYALMHHLATGHHPQVSHAGFVHVPLLSTLPAEDISQGMARVIDRCIRAHVDARPGTAS